MFRWQEENTDCVNDKMFPAIYGGLKLRRGRPRNIVVLSKQVQLILLYTAGTGPALSGTMKARGLMIDKITGKTL
jgi:hypothetical protein